MGILDKVEEIANLGQRKFVVLWGKSNTGKTEVGSTWPKPMLYMQVGDDGANTIRKKKDIMGLRCDTVPSLKAGLKELINKKGAGYKSIFVDTFSMITNMWIDENALQVNLSRLKKTLVTLGMKQRIVAIRGVGYRLERSMEP